MSITETYTFAVTCDFCLKQVTDSKKFFPDQWADVVWKEKDADSYEAGMVFVACPSCSITIREFLRGFSG